MSLLTSAATAFWGVLELALISSQGALEKDGSILLTSHFSAWHYPQRLRLNSTVSNSCKRNFRAPHGKLRQERHVYSNRSIKRPSSSVGAALFLVAEGGPVRHWSIERCRSYGAWPNSGAVPAIDMALIDTIQLIGLTPRTAGLPERIIRPEKCTSSGFIREHCRQQLLCLLLASVRGTSARRPPVAANARAVLLRQTGPRIQALRLWHDTVGNGGGKDASHSVPDLSLSRFRKSVRIRSRPSPS